MKFSLKLCVLLTTRWQSQPWQVTTLMAWPLRSCARRRSRPRTLQRSACWLPWEFQLMVRGTCVSLHLVPHFLGRGLGGACYLFLLFNGGALHEWVLKTKALHIFPWNIKLLFVCLLRTTPQVHNCLDYCPQDHYSLGLLHVRKQFSEECLDTFFFF